MPWPGWLVVVGLLGACFAERPRPSPLEPDGTITVALLRPPQNATVLAGRPLAIEIIARDSDGSSLAALGYVARRVQGGQTVDSATAAFVPRSVARDTFELQVPPELATNTHLSIIGLVFRTSGAAVATPETQVVVAQCTPDIPACR